MNPSVEISKVDLHVLLVVLPGDTVDSDCRALLQLFEGERQRVPVDVVQQGGELELAVLSGSFAHAQQSA